MEPYLNLVNGQPAETLPLADRGLLYGDGVFRTLRVQAGRALWWAEQYAKLADDCARLSIPCPAQALFEADLTALPREDGVVRLTVTRGVGLRGYALPEKVIVTRIVQFMPVPQDADVACLARVHLCRLRLAQQPTLAGVKHLNRLENCLAGAEWSDPVIGEGLLLDAEGHMISGVSSNLCVLRGEVLYTPRLDRCGVAGVARARLMACAPRLGLRVTVTDLTLADLDQADALLFCNSVRGLRWTAALAGRCWTEAALFAPLKEALWETPWDA
jgi:4-amino-4-deoxychorismate lyase